PPRLVRASLGQRLCAPRPALRDRRDDAGRRNARRLRGDEHAVPLVGEIGPFARRPSMRRASMQPMSAKTTPSPAVAKAFAEALEDESPETDEERQLVAEARANFALHGRTRTPEQIK